MFLGIRGFEVDLVLWFLGWENEIGGEGVGGELMVWIVDLGLNEEKVGFVVVDCWCEGKVRVGGVDGFEVLSLDGGSEWWCVKVGGNEGGRYLMEEGGVNRWVEGVEGGLKGGLREGFGENVVRVLIELDFEGGVVVGGRGEREVWLDWLGWIDDFLDEG